MLVPFVTAISTLPFFILYPDFGVIVKETVSPESALSETNAICPFAYVAAFTVTAFCVTVGLNENLYGVVSNRYCVFS